MFFSLNTNNPSRVNKDIFKILSLFFFFANLLTIEQLEFISQKFSVTFDYFYVFSIGAMVKPLLTSCSWYSSACSRLPLHTYAEPELSTLTVRSHALFSLIPGIIVRRHFATCWKVFKLSLRTITLASGYFAFVFFWSKTVLVELSINIFTSYWSEKFA